MKTIIKKIMLLVVAISISGCGLMLNDKKPALRDKEAINSALHYGVISYKWTYEGVDLLSMILFPIGTVIGGIGLFMDKSNNYGYEVIDKDKYLVWQKNYLSSLEKEQNKLFKDVKTK